MPAKLVNLTKHGLRIYDAKRKLSTFVPASGKVARTIKPLKEKETHYANDLNVGWATIPVYTESTPIVGLPAPRKGVILIVTERVYRHCAGRPDVYHPGEVIYKDELVIGCIGLNKTV